MKVWLTYGEEDPPLAKKIKEKLVQAGIEVLYHEDIFMTGDNTSDGNSAASKVDVVVMIFSQEKNVVEAAILAREFQRIMNIKTIAVIKGKRTKTPDYLKSITFIDFSDEIKIATNLDLLIKEIKKKKQNKEDYRESLYSREMPVSGEVYGEILYNERVLFGKQKKIYFNDASTLKKHMKNAFLFSILSLLVTTFFLLAAILIINNYLMEPTQSSTIWMLSAIILIVTSLTFLMYTKLKKR